MKDYKTLKVEPIGKVAPESYPEGSAAPSGALVPGHQPPENVKGGTFWWQLEVTAESEAQSRGSRKDAWIRRGLLTSYRGPTVRKYEAGEEVC